MNDSHLATSENFSIKHATKHAVGSRHTTGRQYTRASRVAVRPAIGRRTLLSLLAAIALSFGFALAGQGALAQDAAAMSPELVNINTADVPTLVQQLKGVGPTRAQEIVRHRETFGPFASTEELMEVKGIGQSTLDMNRSRITLE